MRKILASLLVLTLLLAAPFAFADSYRDSNGLLIDTTTGAILATASPIGDVTRNSRGFPIDSTGKLVINATGITDIVRDGLLAEYRFTDGTGTTLTDYSGNKNNATFPGGAQNPTWIANTGGLSFAQTSNQYLALPAMTGVATIQVVTGWAPTGQNASGHSAVVGNTNSGSAMLDFGKVGATPDQGPSIWNGTGVKNLPNGSAIGIHLLTWVPDASTDKLYIDSSLPAQIPDYAATGTATGLTGTFMFGKHYLGNNYTFNGQMYYALIYNRQITAAEVTQNYLAIQAILAKRGIAMGTATQGGTANVLLCEGDSIAAGQGVTTAFCGELTTNTTYSVFNTGVPSRLMKDLAVFSPERDKYYYSNSNSRNVKLIMAGTNDMCWKSYTPAATYSALAADALAARLAGWKVIVGTMLSRTSCDTNKNTYNGLIRNGWRLFADGLADFAADPNIGADNAYSSSTYFQDGTHPKQAGHDIMAKIASAAVNALDATPVPLGVSPYGSYSYIGTNEETITLNTGGTTTDSTANLLPANSTLIDVCYVVSTTITTATAYTIGDASTAARFIATGGALTAGTNACSTGTAWTTGIASATTGTHQGTAAKVRITTTGTPGAGAIRVTVRYSTAIAPSN